MSQEYFGLFFYLAMGVSMHVAFWLVDALLQKDKLCTRLPWWACVASLLLFLVAWPIGVAWLFWQALKKPTDFNDW